MPPPTFHSVTSPDYQGQKKRCIHYRSRIEWRESPPPFSPDTQSISTDREGGRAATARRGGEKGGERDLSTAHSTPLTVGLRLRQRRRPSLLSTTYCIVVHSTFSFLLFPSYRATTASSPLVPYARDEEREKRLGVLYCAVGCMQCCLSLLLLSFPYLAESRQPAYLSLRRKSFFLPSFPPFSILICIHTPLRRSPPYPP